MTNTHVFISHSSKDDPFVKQLREALEGLGINVWVDSRNLRGGSKLAPEIEAAIEAARQFVVVLSTRDGRVPLGEEGDQEGFGGRAEAQGRGL